LTPEEEEVVTAYLLTIEGRAKLKGYIQLAAAIAADKLPHGGVGFTLARQLAGLPPVKNPHE
jgi:hypothetical protein